MIAQAIHIACMHIPFMKNVLKIEPISLMEWLQILSITLPVVLVMELYKWMIRRKQLQTKRNSQSHQQQN